jgi:hypothetical protein
MNERAEWEKTIPPIKCERRTEIDEAKGKEIADLALGKRYGIQTIARRTGVPPEAVSKFLRKKGIEFHPALKEWRSRETKKGVL